jgi:hypothetical protein
MKLWPVESRIHLKAGKIKMIENRMQALSLKRNPILSRDLADLLVGLQASTSIYLLIILRQARAATVARV